MIDIRFDVDVDRRMIHHAADGRPRRCLLRSNRRAGPEAHVDSGDVFKADPDVLFELRSLFLTSNILNVKRYY